MSSNKVKKAVFPVAGYGTRFLPVTKVNPKEMLPIVDKPLIQYATEEAIAAGITTLIFVNGRNKRAIEDHFDTAVELERRLEESGKEDLLKEIKSISTEGISYINIRQPEPNGLGDAILCAQAAVGDEPFAVLLADDLVVSSPDVNVTGDLIQCYEKYQSTILCTEQITLEQTRNYGVVAGDFLEDDIIKVNQIVEKPDPENAPSQIGLLGRYVLQPSIFDFLKKTKPGISNEIQLTDAIALAIEKEKVYAHMCRGKRYDCGSKQGYLQANVEIALSHDGVKDEFSEYLKNKIKDI